MQKYVYQCRSGASLIVAIGMSMLLILITLGLSAYIQSSVRSAMRVEGSNAAYFAAEGELEQALHNVATRGFGYESSAADEKFEEDYANAEGRYKVHSVSSKDGSNYAVPALGYGTLGGVRCDGDFYAKQEEDCGWNVLNGANLANIFLYNELAGESDFGGGVLDLEVRTVDGSDLFEGGSANDPLSNPVVLNWEVVEGAGFSTRFSADSCTVADACERNVKHGCTQDERRSGDYYSSNNQARMTDFDGGDYELGILELGMDNYENGQCGVGNDFVAHNYRIDNFLEGSGQFSAPAKNPGLKLSVVKADIPNLIYRLRTDAEVLDANIYVEATGVSGEYPVQHSTKLVFVMPQDMNSTVFSTGFLEQ